MHAKCIIVDRDKALVGSANFSNRGRDENLEVGALVRDHHFVQSLAAAWDDVHGELVEVEEH
jgi:phosphatidylserine/phosphatidylglycerophosphate/cardiolipin synthase-like enzyme